jgi:hypothetical protein
VQTIQSSEYLFLAFDGPLLLLNVLNKDQDDWFLLEITKSQHLTLVKFQQELNLWRNYTVFVQNFIEERTTNDPLWASIKIQYNLYKSSQEAEHKFFSFIRSLPNAEKSQRSH